MSNSKGICVACSSNLSQLFSSGKGPRRVSDGLNSINVWQSKERNVVIPISITFTSSGLVSGWDPLDPVLF